MPSFDVVTCPSKTGPLQTRTSVDNAQKSLADLSLFPKNNAPTVVSESSTLEDDVSVGSLSSHFSQVIGKTDHKLAEERGELAEEPLLKANPHRFVLFPIQDDEVSPTIRYTIYDIHLTPPD